MRRGRLIHADVPVEGVPHDARLEPLFWASNVAVYAAHAAAGRTLRARWRELPVRAHESGRPVIYLAWHRFNYAAAFVIRELPEEWRPALIMHDGLASRALTHESSTWLGLDAFVFRRRSPVSPRDQIVDFVRRTRRHVFNLPDSGGPYGRMKPGIVEIARECDAILQPIAIQTRGTLTLGRTLRHVVPLPFCTLEAIAGDPLDGRTATAADCQCALDAL